MTVTLTGRGRRAHPRPPRPGGRRPGPYLLCGTACWLLLAVVTWYTPIASGALTAAGAAVSAPRSHG